MLEASLSINAATRSLSLHMLANKKRKKKEDGENSFNSFSSFLVLIVRFARFYHFARVAANIRSLKCYEWFSFNHV